VPDPDASFAESDFAGNITHLSSQTHDEQEIENYDEDFPETETEENQVLPPEVSHVEETAVVEPVHTEVAAEKGQDVEEAPELEVVTEKEVHVEHQEVEPEEVKPVEHEESVAETQEVPSEPSQSIAPEEHPASEGEASQEHASSEGHEEAVEGGKGAEENHELESLVNGEVAEAHEDEVADEQSKGEEAVGAVAVPEEEPAVVDAETPASSPEPKAPSAEEHAHPNPITNVSSPDLDDAVRMLEGTSLSTSNQPAHESDDSPDEY